MLYSIGQNEINVYLYQQEYAFVLTWITRLHPSISRLKDRKKKKLENEWTKGIMDNWKTQRHNQMNKGVPFHKPDQQTSFIFLLNLDRASWSRHGPTETQKQIKNQINNQNKD